MNSPKIQGLGIVQDGFTMLWKATGSVEGIGWMEASGATLVEAMEALRKRATEMVMAKEGEGRDS
jgi:hypothetical protein